MAALASFLTPFMGSSINLALPPIGDELDLDSLTLSWVATAFLVAAAVCLVPLGKVADIYGRKRVFAWGLVRGAVRRRHVRLARPRTRPTGPGRPARRPARSS